jgi:hypothetical protein
LSSTRSISIGPKFVPSPMSISFSEYDFSDV